MLPLARVSDGQQAQKSMQQILDFFVDRRNYLEVLIKYNIIIYIIIKNCHNFFFCFFDYNLIWH